MLLGVDKSLVKKKFNPLRLSYSPYAIYILIGILLMGCLYVAVLYNSGYASVFFSFLLEKPYQALLAALVLLQTVLIVLGLIFYRSRAMRYRKLFGRLESQIRLLTSNNKDKKALSPLDQQDRVHKRLLEQWNAEVLVQTICKEFERLNNDLIEKEIREVSLKQALSVVRRKIDDVVKERTLQLEAALEEIENKMRDSEAHIKALEESEKRFGNLVSSTALGVCMVGTQGKIEWVNGALCEILDLKESVLKGKSIPELLEEREMEAEMLPSRQELKRFALKSSKSALMEKFVEGAGSSFQDAAGKEMEVWFFVDASAKVKAEQVLRKSLQEVRENGEIRDRFAKMMAHDVRTPLNVILVASSMLKEDGPCADSEEAYKEVQCSVEHISNLMEDLLFVGQWTSDDRKLRLEKINLHEFCSDAVRSIRIYYIDTPEINIDIDENVGDFYTDPMLFRRIVVNLLTNAVKYSGGRPGVSLSISRIDENLVIEIKDCGLGIPEGDIGKIFDTFYRGSNANRVSGRGLGLSIVKESVVLLDGSIHCKSKLHEGTTFRVGLPLRIASRA
ncbi:MAG: ATP-binding protein [Verrucomicrobiota bacterium]